MSQLVEDTPRYYLNPTVRISPLDVSTIGTRYLVEVDGDRHFEVPERIRQVIELLRDGKETAQEIAAALRVGGIPQAEAPIVERVMRGTLMPRGIVHCPTEKATDTVALRKKRSSLLTINLPLLSAEIIRPFTGPLRFFFRKPAFITMLAASAAAHIYFYTHLFPSFHWAAMKLPLSQTLLILVVMNLTCIFHELGHATACRYFNCPHGKIGWGIYIYMFVLYTDVTPAWRLKRHQRALVDFGGMYFELIAAVLILGLMLDEPSPLYFYIFVFLDLSILHSLNPMFKQDGYWLVSDLAGITNLRDVSMEAFYYGVAKLFRSKQSLSPRFLQLPSKVRWALCTYTAASVAFFIALIYWVGKAILLEIIPAYPHTLKHLWELITRAPLDYSALVLAVIHVTFSTLFVVVMTIAGFRFLVFLQRSISKLFGSGTAFASTQGGIQQ